MKRFFMFLVMLSIFIASSFAFANTVDDDVGKSEAETPDSEQLGVIDDLYAKDVKQSLVMQYQISCKGDSFQDVLMSFKLEVLIGNAIMFDNVYFEKANDFISFDKNYENPLITNKRTWTRVMWLQAVKHKNYTKYII